MKLISSTHTLPEHDYQWAMAKKNESLIWDKTKDIIYI